MLIFNGWLTIINQEKNGNKIKDITKRPTRVGY